MYRWKDLIEKPIHINLQTDRTARFWDIGLQSTKIHLSFFGVFSVFYINHQRFIGKLWNLGSRCSLPMFKYLHQKISIFLVKRLKNAKILIFTTLFAVFRGLLGKNYFFLNREILIFYHLKKNLNRFCHKTADLYAYKDIQKLEPDSGNALQNTIYT